MSYIGNPITTAAYLTDQFSGDGSTTAFTMSVAPANAASVLVSVSGVLQDPSTYGVVGKTLNFSGIPPSGVGNISVRYLGIPASGVVTTAYRTVTEFTATAGQTTFTPPSYTVGFINVYRNGVRLGASDFTASNGTTVVLAAGANSGDLVTTESFYVSSVVNGIPNSPGAVSATNLAAGAVQQANLAAGVAGNGPAFSAYAGSSQSISSGWNKVALNTKEFDTNNNFNTSNYRFTPTVAGYYQISAGISLYPIGGAGEGLVSIYKNGAEYKRGVDTYGSGPYLYGLAVSALVPCNGSTDYIELYGYANASSLPTFYGQSFGTFMTGVLARSA